MHRVLQASAALILAALSGAAGRAEAPQDEWIALFNGKNLDGWTPKFAGFELGENYGNTFRVEEGVLKVVYDKDKYEKFGDRFGHLFYKESFSNYRIRVEYRFVGEQSTAAPGWAFRNSGIMVHGQPAESMEKDQPFPVSIEVQLLGGKETGERSTANMCSPGTHIVLDGKLTTTHCINSKSKTYRGDQWVTVEVEVRGSKSIKHFVEGQEVMSYTEPQLDDGDKYAKKLIKDGKKLLDRGTISLQAESHPVEFRKVELKKLPE
jgi:3-keto-disaccharide hydrolase